MQLPARSCLEADAEPCTITSSSTKATAQHLWSGADATVHYSSSALQEQ